MATTIPASSTRRRKAFGLVAGAGATASIAIAFLIANDGGSEPIPPVLVGELNKIEACAQLVDISASPEISADRVMCVTTADSAETSRKRLDLDAACEQQYGPERFGRITESADGTLVAHCYRSA